MTEPKEFWERINVLMTEDLDVLMDKDREYQGAWKADGGKGAWHQALTRKWSRMETQVRRHDGDLFEAILRDGRPEGILDDLRDLRRYLYLVDSEMAVALSRREYWEVPGPGPEDDDFKARVLPFLEDLRRRIAPAPAHPVSGSRAAATQALDDLIREADPPDDPTENDEAASAREAIINEEIAAGRLIRRHEEGLE